MKEKKPQNINMGQRFREAREAKGWTREKLAEKMGLSVQFIADLELGNSGIRLDRFATLCQLLDIEQLPTLFNLETMLANRDNKDVKRVVSMLEAVVEMYFDN